MVCGTDSFASDMTSHLTDEAGYSQHMIHTFWKDAALFLVTNLERPVNLVLQCIIYSATYDCKSGPVYRICDTEKWYTHLSLLESKNIDRCIHGMTWTKNSFHICQNTCICIYMYICTMSPPWICLCYIENVPTHLWITYYIHSYLACSCPSIKKSSKSFHRIMLWRQLFRCCLPWRDQGKHQTCCQNPQSRAHHTSVCPAPREVERKEGDGGREMAVSQRL